MSVSALPVARRLAVTVGGAAFLTALGGVCLAPLASHLIVNLTPSLPRGLYWLSPHASCQRTHVGDLVAFSVPPCVRELVAERGYLPPGALLVKPVAAEAEDEVCTEHGVLEIKGSAFGAIATEDSAGRPLPHASLCGPLAPRTVFVAAEHPKSFDSRIFGPIALSEIKGRVTPLWIF
jgi:conjugative transfer signal peptidase TraF